MPTRSPAAALTTCARGLRVYVRPPRRADTGTFIAAVAASRDLHRAWVKPPATAPEFAAYVARFAGAAVRDPARAPRAGFLACRVADDAPVGVFNVSEIVRGSFESAYLGYYGLRPHAGSGYMREALALVLAAAFRTLRLHRVEANVQPDNARSIALLAAAGFTREGYSRRYLKIAGRWRDHERWAMLAEDWRAR
jgi:[ribosomal protein S5]-alanine N-acetyltransferase